MPSYDARLLEIITSVQEEIILTDDFPAAFRKMISAIEDLTDSDSGFVGEILYDAGEPYLKTYTITDVPWGADGRELRDRHVANGFEFRNLKSLLHQTIATGEPFISNDPGSDPRRGGLPRGHPPLNAFLSLPLRRGRTIVGMLGLANRPGGYDEEWIEILRPLTQTCGNLIVALQADKRRRQAEEMLHEAIEAVPEGFVIYDEQDRLVVCNQAYRKRYQVSSPAIQPGATFESILRYGLEQGQYLSAGDTPESQEAWLRHRLDLHHNSQDTVIQRLSDGTWLRIVERRTKSGGYVGIRADITELKEAEQALRDSEAEASRLALVASRTDNAVIITDAAGQIEWVNDAFTRITGFSLEEAEGQKPGDLLQGPGTDPDTITYMRSCLAAGEAFEVEIINYRKDLSPYWLSIDVQPIHDERDRLTNFIAVERDITRQKTAERVLRQRESKFRSLFDMAPVGILLTAKDGRFVDANDTFVAMTGRTKRELRGLRVNDLLWAETEADRDAYLATFLDALEDSGRFGPVECLMPRRGGDDQTVLLNATTVDINEALPLTWSIVQDISERKRIERIKNEFISVVSHELRTPLTALLGSLGLVKDGQLGDLPPQVEGLLEIAHGNAHRLVELVNDILEMEKIDRGVACLEFAPVDVAALARETIESLTHYATTLGVTLHREVAAGRLFVKADARRLSQALVNLLANGAKFSEPGQAVTLRIERVADRVRFSVVDSGRGIPVEFHQQIFGKFFQVDSSDSRNRNGTGLGLSICQAIVEGHGSRIELVSAPGEGSTFYFDLPEEAEAAPQP